MATNLSSHQPAKYDEQDMMKTAGEVRTNSSVMFSNGLLHMDTPVLANK